LARFNPRRRARDRAYDGAMGGTKAEGAQLAEEGPGPEQSPLTGWLDTLAPVEVSRATDEAAGHSSDSASSDAASPDLALNRPGGPGAAARHAAALTSARHTRAMGLRLEKYLAPDWRILHSVPLGDGATTVDHLLIGPAGVFTVSTHEHPGARVWVSRDEIRVNGQPLHYLRTSLARARRISKLLAATSGQRVRATPCLVFFTRSAQDGGGDAGVVIQEQPEGVLVLDSSSVVRSFRKLDAVLAPEAVDALFEAARRRASWVVERG
jgi:hypothetical protein